MTETETLDALVTRIRADPGNGSAWASLSERLWAMPDEDVARFWADHPDLGQRVCVRTILATNPPPRSTCEPLTVREACRRLDEARAEVTTLRAELASISAEFGLPPTMRPTEGEIRRMLATLRVLTTERSHLQGDLDLARGFIATMVRERDDALRLLEAERVEVKRAQVEVALQAELGRVGH